MKKKSQESNEIVEITKIYDIDNFIGTDFLKTLSVVLNKRYADGWEFVQVYSRGINEYGILYKRIESTKLLGGKAPTFELSE